MKTSLGTQDAAPDACPAPVLCRFLQHSMACCPFSNRRCRTWLGVGAVALLVVFHQPLLRLAAAPCVEDRPIEDCGILVLYGDSNSYHRSAQYDAVAKRWLTRPNGNELTIFVLDGQPPVPVQLGVMPSSGEFIRSQLIARGVAASAVTIVPKPFRNERAAAEWLSQELRGNPTLRVMVVADEYESGRVARLIDAVIPPEVRGRVGLWPLPPTGADRGDWFKSRDGVKRLVNGWQGLLAAALADNRVPDDLWQADRLMTALERRIAGPAASAESERTP